MSILIVGCARSGTHWMARVLRSQGLDVGHERQGLDGIVSWCLAPADTGDLPRWHGPVRDDHRLVLRQSSGDLHSAVS